MDFIIVVYVIAVLISVGILYSILKMIWYTVKMLALRSFMKDLGKAEDVQVISHRSLIKTCFSKKGDTDYTVILKEKTYKISILTFISTRGRWNFEKSKEQYFIECRRRHIFFYKKVKHSEAPEHALTYKGETKFARSELFIPTAEKEIPIFLLYPWPHTVSHTDAKFRELLPGDSVAGVVLMDATLLKKTILGSDEK